MAAANYTKLLLSAREAADIRLSEKGLTGSAFQDSPETEEDVANLSPAAPLVSKRTRKSPAEADQYDDFMTSYFVKLREENNQIKAEATKVSEPATVSLGLKHPKSAETLRSDPAFMSKLKSMEERYPGLTEGEVFKIIDGESAFNPKAVSGAKAAGLFQIMPDSLAELGFTSKELLDMEPAEQLGVYEQYLKRWDYDGSYGLGIVQAAPAYRKSSPDTVVYKKDSAAWKQNPGWRSSKNGPITKRSIEAYYGRTE